MIPATSFSLIIGAYIFGALYLTGIAAAGLAWKNRGAVFMSIACAGVSYLSYFAQVALPEYYVLGFVLVGCTIAVGAAAGFALLR